MKLVIDNSAAEESPRGANKSLCYAMQCHTSPPKMYLTSTQRNATGNVWGEKNIQQNNIIFGAILF